MGNDVTAQKLAHIGKMQLATYAIAMQQRLIDKALQPLMIGELTIMKRELEVHLLELKEEYSKLWL